MPKYKALETVKGKWNEEKMKEALKNVVEGNLTMKEASEAYGVPKSTLMDRYKAIIAGREIMIKAKLGRFESTFSEKFTQQLYQYAQELDKCLLSLTRIEFLRLVFDLAEKHRIPHRFNKQLKMAGKDFLYGFKKKYPDLPFRLPEPFRAKTDEFHRLQKERFFKQLGDLLKKYNFPPSRIYNTHETVISKTQVDGIKEVLTAAEREDNDITLSFAMNVVGHFVPPLFIFSKQKIREINRLMVGAPPESIAILSENACMTGDVFLLWLQHINGQVRASEEQPVLLILDSQGNNKDLAVIEYARQNHIHMLGTPLYSKNRFQPLDRAFFEPFQAAFASANALWRNRNPGVKMTEYDIPAIVYQAFCKSANLELVENGFRCTGIYPFNPDIFNDADSKPKPQSKRKSRAKHARTLKSRDRQAVSSTENIKKTPTIPIAMPSQYSTTTPPAGTQAPQLPSDIIFNEAANIQASEPANEQPNTPTNTLENIPTHDLINMSSTDILNMSTRELENMPINEFLNVSAIEPTNELANIATNLENMSTYELINLSTNEIMATNELIDMSSNELANIPINVVSNVPYVTGDQESMAAHDLISMSNELQYGQSHGLANVANNVPTYELLNNIPIDDLVNNMTAMEPTRGPTNDLENIPTLANVPTRHKPTYELLNMSTQELANMPITDFIDLPSIEPTNEQTMPTNEQTNESETETTHSTGETILLQELLTMADGCGNF